MIQPLTSTLLIVLACAGAVGQVLEQAPMLARGRALASVWLNDEGPYPFLLDTGLQSSVVEREVAQYLNLANLAEAGKYPGVALIENFRVGALAPRPEHVAVMDLTELGAQTGLRVAGVLPAWQPGYELILDLQRPLVSWRPFGEDTLSPGATGTVPMRIDEPIPKLAVHLDGREVPGVGLDLTYAGVAAFPAEVLRPLAQGSSLRIGYAEASHELQRVPSLRVGEARLESALVEVLPPDAPARLGVGFLQLWRCTLNFEYGLLHLDGGTRQAAAFTGCGILLDRLDAGFWRIGVVQGSSAQAAGAQPGDRLVALNGVTAELPAQQLEAMLSAVGAVQVTLERDSQALDLSLSGGALF